MNYTLKWLRTKDFGPNNRNKGTREWSVPSLLRAARAELILQYQEVIPRREEEPSEQ